VDRRIIAELVRQQLTGAQDQNTATGDIPGTISSSAAPAQAVFEAVVIGAARVCDSAFSAVALFDGELLHLVAINKMSPEEMAAYQTIFPRRASRGFIIGRAFIDGQTVHVADIEADPDFDSQTLAVLKEAAPHRTYLGIPILRDGVPIGAIGCGRREVKPFTDSQIALIKTFADQVAITIARREQAQPAGYQT
jgi:GAF domain-containing protein